MEMELKNKCFFELGQSSIVVKTIMIFAMIDEGFYS